MPVEISAPKPITGPNPFSPHEPTAYERFKHNPCLSIAEYLYSHRRPPRPRVLKDHQPVRVVCISDTHCTTPQIPEGDILLHAGDLTNRGSLAELQAQITWLNTLPHTHKVVIGGNHDICLDPAFIDKHPHRVPDDVSSTNVSEIKWGDIIYLNDSAVTLDLQNGRKVRVYGSPQTPECGTWAFQYPPIRDIWSRLLSRHDTEGKDADQKEMDILLTHGAPLGHLDMRGKGCGWLTRGLWGMAKRPRMLVCGHLHGDGGKVERLRWDDVQRCYDGVVSGDRGWMGVLGMMAVIALQIVLGFLVRNDDGIGGLTTIVNAAVVAGEGNKESRQVVTIEI